MGGQPLRLGPFIGGLNTASDPTAIADAELVELTNFELDIDGSLISRPPMTESQGHVDWAERIVCIGEGVFSGSHYLIGSNSSGVYYYFSSSWTLITNTFQASIAIQYADKVYLVPKPGSGSGGKWDPVGGYVAVAAIPKGQAAVIHKERMFIVPGIDSTTNTSRLSFSNVGNPDVWGASDFIDISQGDGTKLIDLTIIQDNLLLFKNQSTHILSYDVRPTDAVNREISTTIGVSGQHCVVNYENQVYVFHNGWVYEVINYDFNRLNTKVPFVRDETAPAAFSDEKIFLSIYEDRLLCRFYSKIYVYGMRTRTWSEWESNSDHLQYFGPIITIRPSTGNQYYAGSCISAHVGVIRFYNEYTTLVREQAFNTTVTATDNFNETVVDGWGTTDQGQTWINSGGAASDYDKTGTLGTHTLTSVGVFRSSAVALGIVDPDQKIFVKTSAVAAGAAIFAELTGRDDQANTFYHVRLVFNADQSMTIALIKTVASTPTTLASVGTGLTHVANTEYGLRLRIQGTSIQARAWATSGSEPLSWQVTATDSSITAAGAVKFRSALNTGNTNTLPVTISVDNYECVSQALTNYDIDCSVKTKNFDTAISHQFKRLWWWGADLSTPRNIVGTATPIVLSFSVTWGQISAYTWGDVSDNTWGQPLTDALGVSTSITGQGGMATRRYAKFNKGLRFRQISFRIQLVTNGSAVDGPARLFTMTMNTESKANVPKSVN